MDDCFELVRAAGAPRRAFEDLRKGTESIKTVTLGATLLKNACINLCLAAESRTIVELHFISRQDVEVVKNGIIVSFKEAEEVTADSMDAMTYRALVELHS